MICEKQTAALYAAITESNVQKAEEAIRQGADVNFYDRHQRDISIACEPPIVVAAKAGNRKMIELLVESGADVNLGIPECSSPLLIAIYCGRVDLAKYLFDKGGDIFSVSMINLRPSSPLSLAILKDNDAFASHIFNKCKKRNFNQTYQQKYWLSDPSTEYRHVTELLAQEIKHGDAGNVRRIFELYEDKSILANAFYFPETGYHSSRWSEKDWGDRDGPLFYAKDPLFEQYKDARGIRLLAIALESKNHEVIKFLVEQGARIPHISPDFPEEAMAAGGPPCGREVTDPAIYYEAYGAKFSSGPRTRQADLKDLVYDYHTALRDYLLAPCPDKVAKEKKAIVRRLGVEPEELRSAPLPPGVAKLLSSLTNMSNIKYGEAAVSERQNSR